MYRFIVGPDSVYETSKDNGIGLIHFTTSHELTISRTFLPEKNIHKYTWDFSNGLIHNQIDYIIMSKIHLGCNQKVKIYRKAGTDSDHYLLFKQFNLRLSTKWHVVKKINKKKYNVQRLEDPGVLKRFVERLQENIWTNQSEKIKETRTIDSTWSYLKKQWSINFSKNVGIEKRKRGWRIGSIMCAKKWLIKEMS